MKFLSTVTTSIILLSPFAANAYDANEQLQECVIGNYSHLHNRLIDDYTECREKTGCPQLKRDLDNITQVWDSRDIIFSQIQLDYDTDASTIIFWGASVGLNEANTHDLAIRTVDKCGLSF